MPKPINVKEALEQTFEYLHEITSPVECKNLRLKLSITVPPLIVQVITPETFSTIIDLTRDYVTDRKCHDFYTNAQFRKAWAVITGQNTLNILFVPDVKSSATIP
ncbi:hypothetical protein ES703_109628 [subsurface metagenome]